MIQVERMLDMLLIGNGTVITRDKENPLVEQGCVVVDGTKIVEVGETLKMRQKYNTRRYLDAKGKLIMPGLINTHHHIYSAFARGASIQKGTPENFTDILEGLWWKLDRALTLKDVKYSALATFTECIKNGVTTVFDHHASYGAVEDSLFILGDVAHRLGLRANLCYEVSDRDGEKKCAEAIEENRRWMEYALEDQTGMLAGMMGLHASFTLSDKTLEECREATPKGSGVHIHVAEAIDDVKHSVKTYGKPVVERLYDLGLLGKHSLAVHCVHINEKEMDLLKGTDTMVVHNPESNMGNAVGCPPAMKLMEKGILTGLGTDGYTSDMMESYKVANVLHKHHLQNPNAAWGEVPRMLFENNAVMANRCFKKAPLLGVLKAGAAADVIVVDYDPPTPLHKDNVNGHLLFGVNGRNVVSTVCDGKILMENRDVLCVDEEKMLAECRAQAADFLSRV